MQGWKDLYNSRPIYTPWTQFNPLRVTTLMLAFFFFFKGHNLFFRAVLPRFMEKVSIKCRVPTYSLLPLLHTHTSSPTIDNSHHGGIFVTINEPALTYHYHPKSIAMHSLGSDKCIMTHLHHCSILQKSVIAPQSFCVLPFHPSLSCNPWQLLMFSLSS